MNAATEAFSGANDPEGVTEMATKKQANEAEAPENGVIVSGPDAQTVLGTKAATRAAAGKGRSKVAKNAEQAVLDAGTSDVEVVRADGTKTTLGVFDPDVDDAPEGQVSAVPARSRSKAAASKAAASKVTTPVASGKSRQQAAADKRSAEKAERELARVRAELEKQKNKAKEEREKAKLAEKDRREADRKAKAEAKLAEKEAKAKERLEARQKQQEEREAAKAERVRLKALGRGVPDDPEKAEQFHQAVAKAEALAVVPANPALIDMGFLSIEGLQLTSVSLVLPEHLPITDWFDLTEKFYGTREIASWAFADALVYGENEYGQSYEVLMDRFRLAKSTLKNYKQAAAGWEANERVPGASVNAHLYALSLKRENPAGARNLLEQMVRESHNDLWLRARLAEYRGATAPEGTPSGTGTRTRQSRAAVLANLAAMPLEQFEEGLAVLPTDEQQAQREDFVESLYADANANDAVPADRVRSALVFLSQRVTALEGERNEWRQRALAAEELLVQLGEAQARVAEHADPLAFLNGDAEGEAIEGEVVTEGEPDYTVPGTYRHTDEHGRRVVTSVGDDGSSLTVPVHEPSDLDDDEVFDLDTLLAEDNDKAEDTEA